jgi:hypothetical protein
MNSPYYDYYYFIFKYSNRREHKKKQIERKICDPPQTDLRLIARMTGKCFCTMEFVIPACPESYLLLYL